MAEIATKFAPKTIQDIVNCYVNGHLNLSPGFQRDSVWNERDRQKLIEETLTKAWDNPSGDICNELLEK